jgi:transcription elongation factor Elf1
MNNIKEIAAKANDKLASPLSDEDATTFAEALIAEIQKQNEPVAWVIECEEYNSEGERPILREVDYYNDVIDNIPAGTKLFTFPPSIESEREKVAEACAEYVGNLNATQDNYVNGFGHIAKLIRAGKWKEYL